MQWLLAGATSLSLVPTSVTHSPGSILPLPLHWVELLAALGKTPGSFSYSLATTNNLFCRVSVIVGSQMPAVSAGQWLRCAGSVCALASHVSPGAHPQHWSYRPGS